MSVLTCSVIITPSFSTGRTGDCVPRTLALSGTGETGMDELESFMAVPVGTELISPVKPLLFVVDSPASEHVCFSLSSSPHFTPG